MKLREHIDSFPRHLRTQVRQEMALAAGVSEPAVRHWANGTRKVHPNKVLALEAATKGKVSRYDLRPDVYGTAP